MSRAAVNSMGNGSSVVARLGAVLTVLMNSESSGVNASHIARQTELPVPTAYRLLSDMARTGLTRQDPATKYWTLGPLTLGLSTAAQRQITLLDLAQPYLEDITRQTDETSVLVLRDGTHATYADFVEGPQRLTLRERVGMRRPLTVGASRQVILAHLPDQDYEETLTALHASGDLTDIESMRATCRDIREHGYAFTRGAITPGASGIAVPLCPNTNTVTGSLMVAIPDVRCTDDTIPKIASTLTNPATSLSHLLNSTPPESDS